MSEGWEKRVFFFKVLKKSTARQKRWPSVCMYVCTSRELGGKKKTHGKAFCVLRVYTSKSCMHTRNGSSCRQLCGDVRRLRSRTCTKLGKISHEVFVTHAKKCDGGCCTRSPSRPKNAPATGLRRATNASNSKRQNTGRNNSPGDVRDTPPQELIRVEDVCPVKWNVARPGHRTGNGNSGSTWSP